MTNLSKSILSNNIVINVILLDEALVSTWQLSENQEFGPDGGQIGDVWNGTEYEKPIVTIPPPTVNDVEIISAVTAASLNLGNTLVDGGA